MDGWMSPAMRLRFTIRDLLWLTLVVATAMAWSQLWHRSLGFVAFGACLWAGTIAFRKLFVDKADTL